MDFLSKTVFKKHKDQNPSKEHKSPAASKAKKQLDKEK